jgi:hypothetical protein
VGFKDISMAKIAGTTPGKAATTPALRNAALVTRVIGLYEKPSSKKS